MTETEHIRWEDDGRNGFEGYAGTLDRHLFSVWQSLCDGGNYIIGEWALTTQLPAPLEWRTPHGFDPDALKAEAEHRLERFVSSLGAIFPEDEDDAIFDERPTGEAFAALYAPGCRVRFEHPDGGYPADQKLAAAFLTPGEVYVITWADIGRSSTRLALAGIDTHGQGFNSVLFEPVTDLEAAKAAGTETADA